MLKKEEKSTRNRDPFIPNDEMRTPADRECLYGARMISLHSPNKAGLERAMFLPY